MRLRRRMLLAIATIAFSLSGCGPSDSAAPPPLHPTASAPANACPGAQAYQHATLDYRVCYPTGWITRDYTAEPGGGGALSVVAFGPTAGLPEHVPQGAEYAAPIDVRVVGGAKSVIEPSLAQGNQLSHVTVAGQSADRIQVTDPGPAQGSIILIVEHDADTYLLEKGPGTDFGPQFEAFVASFRFGPPA